MLTIKEEIAKNIAFYRKRANLTQKELASKIGVKNTAVSNWESGKNSIDIDTLVELCRVLDVSICDIYGIQSGSVQLSSDEERLVSLYRSTSDQGKAFVLQAADAAARTYKKISPDSADLEAAQ